MSNVAFTVRAVALQWTRVSDRLWSVRGLKIEVGDMAGGGRENLCTEDRKFQAGKSKRRGVVGTRRGEVREHTRIQWRCSEQRLEAPT